jgi:zinc transport system permease protein
MSIGFNFSVFTSPFFDTSVFLYAGIVGVLTGICASVLGVNLVLKRYSMIGDGLSHVGFLALSIAALIGVTGDSVLCITVPVVTAAAFLLMWLSDSGKLKGDAATALVSVGTVAVGYVIFSLAKAGAGDICAGLFGASILTLKSADLVLSVIIALAVLLFYILFYNKIFSATFDESFARSTGVNTKAFNMLLSVMTAVTIVVGMKLIGSIMISAVIVIPAITAMRITKKFKTVVILSAVISVVCYLLGFLFAVTFVITSGNDTVMLPVGATIVCFNVLALLLTIAVKLAVNRIKA